MKLYGPLNTGSTTGGAGTSTNNATSTIRLCGYVAAVRLRYNGSPPGATTDVTVATAGTTCPAVTILTITDAATDGWFYPHAVAQTTAGATATFDGTNEIYVKIPIDDFVKITIAQANDADSADVWLLLED
jgi:hypothetical protein